MTGGCKGLQGVRRGYKGEQEVTKKKKKKKKKKKENTLFNHGCLIRHIYNN